VHQAGRVVSVELGPADSSILADLRAWVEDLLADAGAAEQAIEATLVTLTELVSNALTHGHPAGQCRLHLTPRVMLRIEVDDHTPQLPALTDHHNRSLGVGGLGLHLVDRMASSWGITPTPTGKTVWAEINLRTARSDRHTPGHTARPAP
jgi:anti-sigma regulatory factor (Ser/Thr protein kinase)